MPDTIKTITFSITIGEDGKQTTRDVTIDPRKIPMKFFKRMEEAKRTGEFTPQVEAIQRLLKISEEEADEITLEQYGELWQSIARASEELSNSPNA